jgi:hypothetical protein
MIRLVSKEVKIMEKFKIRQVRFSTMGLWIEVYSTTQSVAKGDRLLIKVYYYDTCSHSLNNKYLPREGLVTVESMICNNPLTLAKDAHQKIFYKMIHLFQIDFESSIFYDN